MYFEEHVMHENILQPKTLTKDLYVDLKKCDLSKIKFHMLDHMIDEVSWFGALKFLVASSPEYFNYGVNEFIRVTSVRLYSTLEEAVRFMNMSLGSEET